MVLPALLAGCHFAPSAGQSRAWVYERVMAAAVEVLVDNHLSGSGWIADPRGWVVTAAHMASARIEVRTSVGRFSAELVATDRGQDLALLRLPERAQGYPSVPLAPHLPGVGAEIFLMGAPIYRHGVFLPGRVARPTPAFEYLGNEGHYVRVIHVAAQTPRGTSGGPWVNGRGEVVGLQSGMMLQDKAAAGIAFLIPLEDLRRLLAAKSHIDTATLGAACEELSEQSAAVLVKYPPRAEGVILRRVLKGSPAHRAGLADGDLVVGAGGLPIRLRDELLSRVRALEPGSKIELSILDPSAQTPRTVTVELGSLRR